VVSIHAPTRGATAVVHFLYVQTWGFNPRTYAGCDLRDRMISEAVEKFQSTRSHGARQKVTGKETKDLPFQSTHPRGVRQKQRDDLAEHIRVSIHAPTRGATCDWCKSSFPIKSFNPRTHAGCDRKNR
jgi:hypothetical protein